VVGSVIAFLMITAAEPIDPIMATASMSIALWLVGIVAENALLFLAKNRRLSFEKSLIEGGKRFVDRLLADILAMIVFVIVLLIPAILVYYGVLAGNTGEPLWIAAVVLLLFLAIAMIILLAPYKYIVVLEKKGPVESIKEAMKTGLAHPLTILEMIVAMVGVSIVAGIVLSILGPVVSSIGIFVVAAWLSIYYVQKISGIRGGA